MTLTHDRRTELLAGCPLFRGIEPGGLAALAELATYHGLGVERISEGGAPRSMTRSQARAAPASSRARMAGPVAQRSPHGGASRFFVGLPLWAAGLLWLLYLALEPYVRRFWPTTLVSWSKSTDTLSH